MITRYKRMELLQMNFYENGVSRYHHGSSCFPIKMCKMAIHVRRNLAGNRVIFQHVRLDPAGLCIFWPILTLSWLVTASPSTNPFSHEILRSIPSEISPTVRIKARNTEPKVKNWRESGSTTSSRLWLKASPRDKLRRLLGKVTGWILWLKSSPKVKLWRLLGKFTNSKLMLYLAGSTQQLYVILLS